MQNSVHIIGAGLAGWQLAQDLRKADENIQITLICANSGDYYNKILLSTMFTKNMQVEALVSKTAPAKAEDLEINLLAYTIVKNIDSSKKLINLENGTSINYQNLVLATGANPIKLPFLIGNNRVFFVNNLEDYKVFRQNIKPKMRVGILGAGLVGVEFANDLLNSDVEVVLISDTPNILPNLAPVEVSEILLEKMQHAGMQSILGAKLMQAIDDSTKLNLKFDSREDITVDILLSAIGLRANVELAESAGCVLDGNAIKVNQQLQTSVANIYALGDCVSIEGHNLMYIEPMQKSAAVLAQNILNNHTALSLNAMPVILKTNIYPLVSAMPQNNVAGNWQIDKTATGVNAKFLDKDNKVKGFVLGGSEVRYATRLAKQLPILL